jgi:hypothetical protein
VSFSDLRFMDCKSEVVRRWPGSRSILWIQSSDRIPATDYDEEIMTGFHARRVVDSSGR